jgi:hypothetical protein
MTTDFGAINFKNTLKVHNDCDYDYNYVFNVNKIITDAGKAKNTKPCGFGYQRADSSSSCTVSVDSSNFGDCTNQTFFGYKNGDPCILIKLNRV